MSVHVGSILDRKGHDVFTLDPGATVLDAVCQLREHNIGALVISRTGLDIVGIVSERDVVRRLADDGSDCLGRTVSEIMTRPVTTCERDATADDLMSLMTAGRIRHVPVVQDGNMIGLVSIRDVVKSYTDELEVKTEALADYVTGSAY